MPAFFSRTLTAGLIPQLIETPSGAMLTRYSYRESGGCSTGFQWPDGLRHCIAGPVTAECDDHIRRNVDELEARLGLPRVLIPVGGWR